MPRDVALILSDVRGSALSIVCEACQKARSASVHDRCKAVYRQMLV
jgi:hypothetical protein